MASRLIRGNICICFVPRIAAAETSKSLKDRWVIALPPSVRFGEICHEALCISLGLYDHDAMGAVWRKGLGRHAGIGHNTCNIAEWCDDIWGQGAKLFR